MKRDDYLGALAGDLRGPNAARDRLLTELRDHIDDATADELRQGRTPSEAEHLALNRLGNPDNVVTPWRAYTEGRRRETRKRVAILTLAAATASALAVAQHASPAFREPAKPCSFSTTEDEEPHTTQCPSPAATRNP